MVRGTAVPRVDLARDPQLRRWRQLDEEYLCTRIRRSGELTLTYRPSSVSRRELAALVDVEQQVLAVAQLARHRYRRADAGGARYT